MDLRYHTEPGGKIENEDFVIARRHPRSSDSYICLLADGQGGRAHGAIAARTACETAWNLASERRVETLFEPSSWVDILQQADHQTCTSGGFTTLIGIAVSRHSAAGASSGDSKVYFKRPSDLQLIEWTEGQRKHPPVGSGSANFSPFSCSNLNGGRVLIVSDGAWKYCSYETLKSSFAISPDAAVAQIKAAIIGGTNLGLPDDLSIIAVDLV